MAGPKEHYRLSPSSSSRWLACPFSAQDDLPQFPSAAAEEGTNAHRWGAEVLLGICDMGEVPYMFKDGVAMYVSQVWQHNIIPLVERKWESLEIPEFGGTVDALIIKDGRIGVFDFKYGKYPVKAKDNTQLLSYAAIAAEHFEADQFFGVIVQPNSSCRVKIETAEYTPSQVSYHRGRVKVAATSDEKVVGQQCFFCPLRRADQCEEGAAYAAQKNWKYK